MVEFDPLYIITIISVSIAAIVGIFTIRNEIKKGAQERDLRVASQIKGEGLGIRQFIDERLGVVDVKVQKHEDDIKDIETDMKQMAFDFKNTCEKLSKHDYIIEGIVPEFSELQKQFYTFKTAVDHLEDLVITNSDNEKKSEDQKKNERKT